MQTLQLPKLSDKEVMGLLAYYLSSRRKLTPKLAPIAKEEPVWQLEMAVRNLKLARLP